ncbi:hypothetical protein JOF41_007118 [Saccharothrix coeruleofusca]|uniref:nucleotidyl transferase AbiEii/AbiGii toxin family protein n=1 Tax=Saccharothrix coeruleofusca TaxID=33919 RepID=UPI001AE32BC3|nr:nucleotidyl transferase AbiEii/AbiGii toxin family protein [Saccharothrix coeruleofusca]MBP2340940.1 hypothetical protein [Saccharothrix coeruleofusca]
MNRPTKATPGGRAYLELRNRARRERRTTQELLVLYVLERWLARLTESPHAGELVLKGGMLLAALGARRPTADADLLAQRLTNDEAAVAELVVAVARTTLDPDDGVEYLPDTVTTRSIREDDLYAGVRVAMDCLLSGARVKLRLDVNFGDPVTPEPEIVALPSQRPGEPAVRVLGYPVETVLAEKLSTAIALGNANTRVRDFADVFVLTGRHRLEHEEARAALVATTAHRGVEIRPLSEVTGSLPVLRQTAYRAFRARLGEDGQHLPADFAEVVAAVSGFADRLADDIGATWCPVERAWR